MFFFFFFSSRRRHTRSLRDWSSDVCSSDLRNRANIAARTNSALRLAVARDDGSSATSSASLVTPSLPISRNKADRTADTGIGSARSQQECIQGTNSRKREIPAEWTRDEHTDSSKR